MHDGLAEGIQQDAWQSIVISQTSYEVVIIVFLSLFLEVVGKKGRWSYVTYFGFYKH